MAAFIDYLFNVLVIIGFLGYFTSFYLSPFFPFLLALKLPSLILFIVSMLFIIISLLHSTLWENITYEFENIEEYHSRKIPRSNASGEHVVGPFGSEESSPYFSQRDSILIRKLFLPRSRTLNLKLYYSKDTPKHVPIEIYLNKQSIIRDSFFPKNTKSWDTFTIKDSLSLGKTFMGPYTLNIFTKGQRFGVANLDKVQVYDSENINEQLYTKLVRKFMNYPFFAFLLLLFTVLKAANESIAMIISKKSGSAKE